MNGVFYSFTFRSLCFDLFIVILSLLAFSALVLDQWFSTFFYRDKL